MDKLHLFAKQLVCPTVYSGKILFVSHVFISLGVNCLERVTRVEQEPLALGGKQPSCPFMLETDTCELKKIYHGAASIGDCGVNWRKTLCTEILHSASIMCSLSILPLPEERSFYNNLLAVI